MPLESNFKERFLECIPQLMNNVGSAKQVQDSVGGSLSDWADEHKRSDLLQNAANKDTLFDDAFYAYKECGETILTLGWDGDAPGMSGACWLIRCEDIYVITSSDYDDQGPFSSLEDALSQECFNTVTANPDLRSGILSKETLLEIAGNVVDWENEGEIFINSELYVVSGEALIPDAK